ncbi:MAG: multicopper oxidase domain-containing protein [Gemmatimonadales bacterium]
MKVPAFALALATAVVMVPGPSPDAAPRVVPNDNRVAAGTQVRDTLHLSLVLQRAEWYPEAEDGPHVTVEAFSEAGKAPSIPAPLIRVREGTIIHATVRNALPDSTANLIGFAPHPIAAIDTITVKPGDSTVVTFRAGVPGTYLYRAVIGNDPDTREAEHETAGGAFVVDPVGGSPPDRIFVMNITFQPIDSTHVKEALGVNGKSWPYTERLAMTVGDSLRWRVVNATSRGHPMHMHGFYFRTTAIGTGLAATTIPAKEQSLAVTDSYRKWSTRDIVWSPDRPGNWLFHCHITFHVVPETRLDFGPADAHQTHSTDPMTHMAGLVLGLTVAPNDAKPVAPTRIRNLTLFVDQGGPRGRAPSTFTYILQNGSKAPAVDSMQRVGSTLFLTRGERADITVHNRSTQAGGIHWHGIELESWSDGVVGWSSNGPAMAPPIMPGGTFQARLLTPRAGTFMYHTHMNDIEQVTGGAVGAIIVLEPGQRFDPSRDHIFLAHWNGVDYDSTGVPNMLFNGDSLAGAPQPLALGVPHRMRFINIGPAGVLQFAMRRDTTVSSWRALAKDGADLPAAKRTVGPAQLRIDAGETYDFEFTPTEPGTYELSATLGPPARWRQRFIVR